MLEYYVFKSLDIPTQIVGGMEGEMHASKYAELMHIRLSLCLSLVSYLCRYFTLLRFYHSIAFILCILHYLSRRKHLTVIYVTTNLV